MKPKDEKKVSRGELDEIFDRMKRNTREKEDEKSEKKSENEKPKVKNMSNVKEKMKFFDEKVQKMKNEEKKREHDEKYDEKKDEKGKKKEINIKRKIIQKDLSNWVKYEKRCENDENDVLNDEKKNEDEKEKPKIDEKYSGSMKNVFGKDQKNEKISSAARKEERKNSDSNIDENTPRSKFRRAKRRFEVNTPKISKFFSDNRTKTLSNPNTSPRESQKVSKVQPQTPSSDTLERETAAFGQKNQFRVFSGPVNRSKSDRNGKKDEIYGKRKSNLIDLESEFEGHFSPKKMPKIDRSINLI